MSKTERLSAGFVKESIARVISVADQAQEQGMDTEREKAEGILGEVIGRYLKQTGVIDDSNVGRIEGIKITLRQDE